MLDISAHLPRVGSAPRPKICATGSTVPEGSADVKPSTDSVFGNASKSAAGFRMPPARPA